MSEASWLHTFAWAEPDPQRDFAELSAMLGKVTGSVNTGTLLAYTAVTAAVFDRHPTAFDAVVLAEFLATLTDKGREVLLEGTSWCRAWETRAVFAKAGFLLRPRPAFLDAPDSLDVVEPQHLDLYWGLYFGTADKAWLAKVLERMAWYLDPPGKGRVRRLHEVTGLAAVWSTRSLLGFKHIEQDVTYLCAQDPALAASIKAAAEKYRRRGVTDFVGARPGAGPELGPEEPE